MRMMLRFTLPVEKSNAAINDGSLARTMESILSKLKPEAAYFAPLDGKLAGQFHNVTLPRSRRTRHALASLPQRQRIAFRQRLAPRLGQERHGEEPDDVEHADDGGRFAVAAEADDDRAGNQRRDRGD